MQCLGVGSGIKDKLLCQVELGVFTRVEEEREETHRLLLLEEQYLSIFYNIQLILDMTQII